MIEQKPTQDDYEDAVRWLAEQMGLERDPEPGVWLATKLGRVVRLPERCDALLRLLLKPG